MAAKDEKRGPARVNTEVNRTGHRALKIISAYDERQFAEIISLGAQVLLDIPEEERQKLYGKYDVALPPKE